MGEGRICKSSGRVQVNARVWDLFYKTCDDDSCIFGARKVANTKILPLCNALLCMSSLSILCVSCLCVLLLFGCQRGGWYREVLVSTMGLGESQRCWGTTMMMMKNGKVSPPHPPAHLATLTAPITSQPPMVNIVIIIMVISNNSTKHWISLAICIWMISQGRNHKWERRKTKRSLLWGARHLARSWEQGWENSELF